MKKLTLNLHVIFFTVTAQICMSQLPNNVNYSWGSSHDSPWSSSNASSDWLFGVLADQSGDYVATGYTENSGVHTPSIVKVSSVGTLLWETVVPGFVQGFGYDVFEIPSGYVVFGVSAKMVGGCAAYTGLFSVLLNKSTGAISSSWGIKHYNSSYLNFPPPLNGLASTHVGEISSDDDRPKGCTILNSSGAVTGFVLCGNYQDKSFPNPGTSGYDHYSYGSFLLKLDINGFPDNTFGIGGVSLFFPNATNNYINSHFNNVCAMYDNSGNLQGYGVTGYRNEQVNTPPSPQTAILPSPRLDHMFATDAFVATVDLAGHMLDLNVFDDSNQNKNGLSTSFPYTDATDLNYCVGLVNGIYAQENSSERGFRIKQLANGGDLIVVAGNDWWFDYTIGSCAFGWPSTANVIINCDVAALRFDSNLDVVWSTNLFQSTGMDFKNDLKIDQVNQLIFVLGSTNVNLIGTATSPMYIQPYVSKLNIAGTILYERSYMDTGASQTQFCPFAFDLTNGNGIIIVGDNEINGDNYQFIEYINR